MIQSIIFGGHMTEMLNAGLELMFIGMGVVFLFLVALIFTTNAMSKLVLLYLQTEKDPAKTTTITHTNDKLVVAAITAAVCSYRSKK